MTQLLTHYFDIDRRSFRHIFLSEETLEDNISKILDT